MIRCLSKHSLFYYLSYLVSDSLENMILKALLKFKITYIFELLFIHNVHYLSLDVLYFNILFSEQGQPVDNVVWVLLESG